MGPFVHRYELKGTPLSPEKVEAIQGYLSRAMAGGQSIEVTAEAIATVVVDDGEEARRIAREATMEGYAAGAALRRMEDDHGNG